MYYIDPNFDPTLPNKTGGGKIQAECPNKKCRATQEYKFKGTGNKGRSFTVKAVLRCKKCNTAFSQPIKINP